MKEEMVYLNGALLPRSGAKIPVYDRGFLYGYGLFETMRAYGGRIFRLERHLERLMEAAQGLGLAGLADVDLGRACYDTLEANDLPDARVRLAVSAGDSASMTAVAPPTILVTATAYAPPPPEVYGQGYRAVVSRLRRFSLDPLAGLKSANYLLSILAKREAEAVGFYEALLSNELGCITEGSISNVFFVAGGALVTPPLDSGSLPGITRAVVLELAREAGIRVDERDVPVKDIGGFTEAFLTNSLLEIMPLVEIDWSGQTVKIGTGKPGEITHRLMDGYREMVAAEKDNS